MAGNGMWGKAQVRQPVLNQERVHYLLATSPLPRLEQIYRVVFERILHEKISTTPVKQAGG
jgi:hypothetical protein